MPSPSLSTHTSGAYSKMASTRSFAAPSPSVTRPPIAVPTWKSVKRRTRPPSKQLDRDGARVQRITTGHGRHAVHLRPEHEAIVDVHACGEPDQHLAPGFPPLPRGIERPNHERDLRGPLEGLRVTREQEAWRDAERPVARVAVPRAGRREELEAAGAAHEVAVAPEEARVGVEARITGRLFVLGCDERIAVLIDRDGHVRANAKAVEEHEARARVDEHLIGQHARLHAVLVGDQGSRTPNRRARPPAAAAPREDRASRSCTSRCPATTDRTHSLA